MLPDPTSSGPKAANDANAGAGRNLQRVNGQYVDESGKPLDRQQLAKLGLDNTQLASLDQGSTMTDVSGGIGSDGEVQGAKGAAFDANGTSGTDTASLADAGVAGAGNATGDGSNSNYTIQKGDTLSELAQKFGTTTEALAAANNIDNPDLIYAGAELVVPGLNDVAPLSNDFVGPPTLAEFTVQQAGGLRDPGFLNVGDISSRAFIEKVDNSGIPASNRNTGKLPKGAFISNFELGAESKDVKTLQNQLYKYGYRDVSRSGVFDLNTAASYQQYKTEVGRGIWNITEDGKHDLNFSNKYPEVGGRAVFGEAAGQNYASKEAVAQSMKSRLEDTKHEFKGLKTYEDVIFQKNAYDAVNPAGDKADNPQYKNLFYRAEDSSNLSEADRSAYYESGRAFLNVAGGHVKDDTQGAMFYYSPPLPEPGYISRGLKQGMYEQVFPQEVKKNEFLFFRYK
ncbi:MAG: LysM peptidoglycan-binding domain-containing protein [Gammaproteobacteria bacterium]|nr:LysM peptidoglycan-binding domain-containing protein [Gammaproteobacteria bacterium]MDH5548214.1 LysM peptidoglycan-binding domain-containing protein [Gammaproteobacteria bacterium]